MLSRCCHTSVRGRRAEAVKELIAAGKWAAAHAAFNDLYIWLDSSSSHVVIKYYYRRNFFYKLNSVTWLSRALAVSVQFLARYFNGLNGCGSIGGGEAIGNDRCAADEVLNGVVKERLKIIPKDLK